MNIKNCETTRRERAKKKKNTRTYRWYTFWWAFSFWITVTCTSMWFVTFSIRWNATVTASFRTFTSFATYFWTSLMTSSALVTLVMELIVTVHGTAGDEGASSKKNFKERFHCLFVFFVWRVGEFLGREKWKNLLYLFTLTQQVPFKIFFSMVKTLVKSVY